MSPNIHLGPNDKPYKVHLYSMGKNLQVIHNILFSNFSYSGELHEPIDEWIKFEEAISMDKSKKKVDLQGVQIDQKKEIMSEYKGISKKFDWGTFTWQQDEDCGAENKYYWRSLFLAIPCKRRFKSFLNSQVPTQCLHYLRDEVDPKSPEMKKYLTTLLEKFPYNKYGWDVFGKENNGKILAQLCVDSEDRELAMLYINKVMGEKLWDNSICSTLQGIPSGQKDLACKLIQSLPWKEIKEKIYHILHNIYVSYSSTWLDVYETVGIIDIAHKVIEVNLQKESSGKKNIYLEDRGHSENEDLVRWQRMLDLILINKDLCERWLDKIAHSPHVVSDIKLTSSLFKKLPNGDEHKPLKSNLLNHFTDCVKEVRGLSYDGNSYGQKKESYSSLIVSLVQPFLENYNAHFPKEFNNLFDYIISSGNSDIVSRILINLFSEDGANFMETEGFKIIFEMYFDRLSKADFNDSTMQGMINLTETIFQNTNNNLIESTVAKFQSVCENLKEPKWLFKLARELLNHQRKFDLTDMINFVLKLFLKLLESKKNIDIDSFYLTIFLRSLFNEEEKFENILSDILSHQFFIQYLRGKAYYFCRSFVADAFKTENFKKFLRIIVLGVGDWLETEHCLKPEREWCCFSYENVLNFTKKLFNEVYFHDVAYQLLCLEQFRIIGFENMSEDDTGRKQVLQNLIHDLKEDFEHHELYAELVSIHINNLKSLKESGVPKISWEQPNAMLSRFDREVENFLKSDQVSSAFSGFTDFDEAYDWINDYAGPHKDYSFSAVARRGEDGEIKVILQKERDLYELTRKRYFDLMVELQELEAKMESEKKKAPKRKTSNGTESNIPSNKFERVNGRLTRT